MRVVRFGGEEDARAGDPAGVVGPLLCQSCGWCWGKDCGWHKGAGGGIGWGWYDAVVLTRLLATLLYAIPAQDVLCTRRQRDSCGRGYGGMMLLSDSSGATRVDQGVVLMEEEELKTKRRAGIDAATARVRAPRSCETAKLVVRMIHSRISISSTVQQ